MDIIKKRERSITDLSIHLPFTLEGRLKKYSTEELHHHDSHQVLRCHSGISLLQDEDKQVPLFNRMTAFIPAGCLHRSIVLGREVKYKSLYIDPLFLPTELNHIRIFDMSELGIALFARINYPLGNRLEEQADHSLQQECLQLFLRILEEDLKQHSPVVLLPVATSPHNKIIIEYIEKHYPEKIELQDFSHLLPCTLRHISRVFKEELNISIFEYLKIYRILQASIELETTNDTITDIAYACGYNSISCFFKDFNTIFSITPRQFRIRNKNVSSKT